METEKQRSERQAREFEAWMIEEEERMKNYVEPVEEEIKKPMTKIMKQKDEQLRMF